MCTKSNPSEVANASIQIGSSSVENGQLTTQRPQLCGEAQCSSNQTAGQTICTIGVLLLVFAMNCLISGVLFRFTFHMK